MPGCAALPPVPPRGPRGRPAAERLPGLECVLLGDGAVAVVEVDGAPLRLQLCDTAGQEELEGLRRLCYGRAEVFLLCFSVVAPASFANLSARRLPELRRHCPAAPVLLVGTQADLRHDARVLLALARRRQRPVPAAAARALAARLPAAGYVECSALTQHNLKAVFDAAIAAAPAPPGPPPDALQGLVEPLRLPAALARPRPPSGRAPGAGQGRAGQGPRARPGSGRPGLAAKTLCPNWRAPEAGWRLAGVGGEALGQARASLGQRGLGGERPGWRTPGEGGLAGGGSLSLSFSP